jgi:DNA repair exonuclease SbcCD ATPase subunit
MSDLTSIRNQLEQRKGKRQEIERMILSCQQSIREQAKDLRRHEQAREVINQVGLATQNQLSFHISEITSLALNAVFPHPYELKAEFVQRRNKTECDLLFVRGEEKIDPLSAAGGGAVDVASFALRIASWSMQRPRSRAVIILDEPFKHLSTNLLPQAGEMLKQISDKLQLQIIMVTHCEELIDTADKVFEVSIRKGISNVKNI